jgi:multidrug efflux pump subunit AcrA (membrane-fusion protein)
MPGISVSGVITTIAAEAEEGNAFPVTVSLVDNRADLRPGMTASVTFNFTAHLQGRDAFLIPLSAIAIDAALRKSDEYPRNEAAPTENAPIFILDTQKGQIQERKVLVGDLRGNELEVYEGLSPGELVVTAGVAFLRDGMKAEPWKPEYTTGRQRGKR